MRVKELLRVWRCVYSERENVVACERMKRDIVTERRKRRKCRGRKNVAVHLQMCVWVSREEREKVRCVLLLPDTGSVEPEKKEEGVVLVMSLHSIEVCKSGSF